MRLTQLWRRLVESWRESGPSTAEWTDHDLDRTAQTADLPERVVTLDGARVLYEDRLPMSDVLVAASGDTCCLRRIPDRSEVMTWKGAPEGAPTSWTGSPSVPLVALISFDGEQVYGRTRSALLIVRPDRVETLYETTGQIAGAALSANGSTLLWTERGPARLCSMSVSEDRRVRQVPLPSDCVSVQATWLPDGEIIACLIRVNGGKEAITVHVADLELSPPLIDAHSWALQPIAGASPRSFFLCGAPRHSSPYTAQSGSQVRKSAIWIASLQASTLTCVSRGRAVSGASSVVGGTLLFADAWEQTAESSVLVAASPTRPGVAHVPEFLREFCVSGDRLLFCTRGDRFSLRSLDVRPLLAVGTPSQTPRIATTRI